MFACLPMNSMVAFHTRNVSVSHIFGGIKGDSRRHRRPHTVKITSFWFSTAFNSIEFVGQCFVHQFFHYETFKQNCPVLLPCATADGWKFCHIQLNQPEWQIRAENSFLFFSENYERILYSIRENFWIISYMKLYPVFRSPSTWKFYFILSV